MPQTSCSILIAFIAALVGAAIRSSYPFITRLVHLVSAESSEKELRPLRIGLLGASFIGRVALIHPAATRRDVVVVAVASRSEAKAIAFAKKHGIDGVHGGSGAYDALLRRPDVDAVYISLPTRLHVPWATKSLQAGKHVLLEKPLASNQEGVVKLEYEADRVGKVLLQAAHYRYHPSMQRVREIVSGGALGNLSSIDVRFVMLDPKAILASMLGNSRANKVGDRLQERVKNLDRWWYCIDALLFSVGASSVVVLAAQESRFSLQANLSLHVRGQEINATIYMARDRLWPLFDWSLRAVGDKGNLLASNIGFPFLWHAIDMEIEGVKLREQLYGNGETTFQYQLDAFVQAVRRFELVSPSGFASESFRKLDCLTMETVDAVLAASGGGLIPCQSSS